MQQHNNNNNNLNLSYIYELIRDIGKIVTMNNENFFLKISEFLTYRNKQHIL